MGHTLQTHQRQVHHLSKILLKFIKTCEMDDKAKPMSSINPSVTMLNKDEKSSKEDGKDGKIDLENSANISAQEKINKDTSMTPKLSDDPFKIKDLSGPNEAAKDFSSVNLSQSGDKRPRESSEDDANDETLKKKS